MDRPTPEQWHSNHHERPDLSVGECWRCQRARAVCRSKIRFDTWQEADAWVWEFNTAHGFGRAVSRYGCRWCPGWHMTTAKRKAQRVRVEKQRRKALWKAVAL